jgi:uncharacterized membrane protein
MMTQPIQPPAAAISSAPARSRWSWRDILLVVSLAVNLFVLGAIAADRFSTRLRDQAFGPQLTQLMPRKFLLSLDADRRREIIGMVRNHRLAMREGREQLKAKALAIADALAARPYDSATLTAAVDEFGRTSNRMVDQGLGIAAEVLRDLTDGERIALAQAIRDRANPRPTKPITKQ